MPRGARRYEITGAFAKTGVSFNLGNEALLRAIREMFDLLDLADLIKELHR